MRCSKSSRRTPTARRTRWGGAPCAGRAGARPSPDRSLRVAGVALVREGSGPRRYCGLARDPEAKAPNCGSCGSDDANWLRVLADKKQEVPWIQAKTLTPEEAAQRKQAEIAAKRAEVEANVKKALADRSKS